MQCEHESSIAEFNAMLMEEKGMRSQYDWFEHLFEEEGGELEAKWAELYAHGKLLDEAGPLVMEAAAECAHMCAAL